MDGVGCSVIFFILIFIFLATSEGKKNDMINYNLNCNFGSCKHSSKNRSDHVRY